jgi:hypothetical protein
MGMNWSNRREVSRVLIRCYHKTVDFATDASQNRFRIWENFPSEENQYYQLKKFKKH